MDEDEVRMLWRIYGENIYRDNDGYFVYLPKENQGVFNSLSLRSLADLLDFVNQTWDARIRRYFNKHWPPVAPEVENTERI